jgi:hypothetical protein
MPCVNSSGFFLSKQDRDHNTAGRDQIELTTCLMHSPEVILCLNHVGGVGLGVDQEDEVILPQDIP